MSKETEITCSRMGFLFENGLKSVIFTKLRVLHKFWRSAEVQESQRLSSEMYESWMSLRYVISDEIRRYQWLIGPKLLKYPR